MKDSRPAPSTGRPEDEGSLLARCRAGDTRAFEVLVQRYQDRAYGLALRLLRSAPDAEEVTQDAFVRAWRSLADFRGDSSFSTWLYRIVWRRSVDRAATLRTRRMREEPLEAPVGWEPRRGEAAVAAEEMPSGADASEWMRLTEGLSEPQQAVVTLFYYEDMALKDVARALEMPEGTVKTHLSRARAVLRAKHAEQRGTDGA
ncbi:MAG TPA: sigma-70 family RNA polymerase sigma factor [Candidatus Eisenbacteria bacterium]|nr:sigma-70 family RNA polymerase sigma factor [Candidatus Eisenbacteria bacterium]